MGPTGDCTLHFFDAPSVATPQAARAYVDGGAHAGSATRQKLNQLLALISQVYQGPRDGADMVERSACAWPLGLPVEAPASAVLTLPFNPNFAERGFYATLAAFAMQAGLRMLDARNAVLYLEDGNLVKADGSRQRCRGVTPFAASLMRLGQTELDVPGIRAMVGTGMAALLAFQGFERLDHGELTMYSRQHGEMHQTIRLHCAKVADAFELQVGMFFTVPSLHQVWRQVLGEDMARWHAQEAQRHAGRAVDIWLDARVLEEDGQVTTMSFLFRPGVRHPADLHRFLSQLCAWLAQTALAGFERIRDLPTLAEALLSDDEIERLEYERLSAAHQASLLVLARLQCPARFDDLCRRLHRNRFNEQAGWPELSDPRLHHLARLIAALRVDR